MLRDLLSRSFGRGRVVAKTLVSKLPAYQVALWPDGWDMEPGGAVLVRDTHCMAEARRWYALADRNRSRGDGRRVMSLLGIFVPRSIVDLADRRFPSENAASVAVQLIAGEWIAEQRRRLLQAPERALTERLLCWRGSRYESGMDGDAVLALVDGLIRTSVAERLIPDVDYRAQVHRVDGYGIVIHRCVLDLCLDPGAVVGVLDLLRAALVPWNRVVVRDGVAVPLIALAPRQGVSEQKPAG